jgi:hypothetical protein
MHAVDKLLVFPNKAAAAAFFFTKSVRPVRITDKVVN